MQRERRSAMLGTKRTSRVARPRDEGARLIRVSIDATRAGKEYAVGVLVRDCGFSEDGFEKRPMFFDELGVFAQERDPLRMLDPPPWHRRRPRLQNAGLLPLRVQDRTRHGALEEQAVRLQGRTAWHGVAGEKNKGATLRLKRRSKQLLLRAQEREAAPGSRHRRHDFARQRRGVGAVGAVKEDDIKVARLCQPRSPHVQLFDVPVQKEHNATLGVVIVCQRRVVDRCIIGRCV